jgi:ribosome-binding factor A
VTLTGIKVSGDLSYADVYLTVLSKNSAAEASTDLAILNKASGFLRSQLMQVIRIRAMPKLRFHYDESVGHGQQMEKLIAQAIDADQQHASRRSSDDHYTDP